jgi:hypothetical protein
VRDWIKRLPDTDVRILYFLMALLVTIPLVKPMGLPLIITDSVRKTYNRVNQVVQAGDIVLIDVEFDPQRAAEMEPLLMGLGRHVASRGAKIILYSMSPGGFRFEIQFEEIVRREFKMEYGKDILSLPYRAGQEGAYASLGKDMKGLYNEDYYGKPLAQYPLWQRIKSVADVKLALIFASADEPVWFIRQVSQVNKIETMAGTAPSAAAYLTPFWQSGQLTGFVVGTSGGAEYEKLSGFIGKAAAQMDSQSVGHFLITLFVILGNVGYILTRADEKKAK